MKNMSSSYLNQRFGIDNFVTFIDKDELIFINGQNKFAKFAICLQGAQITSFKPKGNEDIIWISEKSHYELGHPIRGGIPVCWPWFGVHPTEYKKPSHGFARRLEWDLKSIKIMDDQQTIKVTFELTNNEKTKKWWPYEFKLRNIITLGKDLEVELITQNKDTEEFQITQALHTYFNVSNISKINISGLENKTFIDTLEGNQEKIEKNRIRFDSEFDNIYIDTEDECIINDPGFKRKISVAKKGSKSTVVWNPWVEKSRKMSDFGNEEYQNMVCVETTNAANDIITIPPGKKHSIKAIIGLV